MLRINQQSNAAAAKSYYSSAAEYYGAGEQEMVGAWGGKAADRLGLDGDILKQHFERLCDNRHPFTGERLTARMRADRRVGYDFTFDVCKSVSILYGLTEDPAILDAFRWALRATMEAMEEGVKVRVRKRGQMGERLVGNMAWAEYIHFTARPVKGQIDPHLHAHAFVPNICWDHVERMWKAIDVASLKEDAPHWQAMFQKHFGQRLAELGYAVAWKGDGFEIAGIERSMIDRFSRRTNHINQVAARRGITDPDAKAELGAQTRERKRKDATMPQLRAQWRERLTDDERIALAQAAVKQRHLVPGADGGSRRERSTGPAYRQVHVSLADDQADQRRLHEHVMQRQRIAAHERARASHLVRPAPPPPPRQAAGYGR
jgi:conjugative relaxase-like TrwC/TraI family protein